MSATDMVRFDAAGEDARMVPAHQLTKLSPVVGDAGWVPPLAYVNAIFAERQGHVNVRLQSGHSVALVQRKPLSLPPCSKDDTSCTPQEILLHQLQQGELGLWHVDTLASEEHCWDATGLQEQREDAPPSSYTLPLGARQMQSARAHALPGAVGHPIRVSPGLRAIPACCRQPPSSYFEGDEVVCPDAISSIAAPSFFAPEEAGATAHSAIFAVAFLDDMDGSTWEDAGGTSLTFGSEQGRCFLYTAQRTASTSSPLLRREDVQGQPPHALRHLDVTGRARGFVRKGTPLAHFKDGASFLAPYDAWVEAWGHSRRSIATVLFLREQEWRSGMKVVWMLQKSVLTGMARFVSAPVAVSCTRAEASCISRNAPATHVASTALKLLLARGLCLDSEQLCACLPGIAALLRKHDCPLDKLRAARELTPGICANDL